MTDWQFAQTDPSEEFAKLHLFDAESGATLVPERVTAAA